MVVNISGLNIVLSEAELLEALKQIPQVADRIENDLHKIVSMKIFKQDDKKLLQIEIKPTQ